MAVQVEDMHALVSFRGPCPAFYRSVVIQQEAEQGTGNEAMHAMYD